MGWLFDVCETPPLQTDCLSDPHCPATAGVTVATCGRVAAPSVCGELTCIAQWVVYIAVMLSIVRHIYIIHHTISITPHTYIYIIYIQCNILLVKK